MAAREVGWITKAWVEIDPFCQKVLKKNFPNAIGHGDIKEFDGTKYRGAIDIITGGFPCQPFSVAGKRKGKEDDRYLWPEMLRVISEVRPAFIIGENVTGIIGLALKQVLTSLEAEGYNTETFIIPACAINAPHRRDRVWIVAYDNGIRRSRNNGERQGIQLEQLPRGETRTSYCPEKSIGGPDIITNPDSERLEIGQLESNGKEFSPIVRNDDQWKNWPSKPGICRRDDGISNRVDRIKVLGNAIVPQVAIEIFKAIDSIKQSNLKS